MEGEPGDAAAELVDAAFAHLEAGLEVLASLDLVALPEPVLLHVLTRSEQHARQLPAFDHWVLAQLVQRNTAGQLGYANLTSLLVDVLRVSASEAKAREKAARDLGPRQAFSGVSLEPVYPVVAYAQGVGEVSVEHARVVVRTIEKLPAALREHGPAVEQVLTDAAREFSPRQVAQLGDRALAFA